MINNKELPSDYERVRQLKIKQFKKLIDLGWDIPEHIIKDLGLEEYVKEKKKERENKFSI
ncbi:MAG: hypothetical protein RMJ34_05225, partial [candidate division WOR-3 bacterium]|nr:hypothetical protein [candidate division WOR-3 bacterium]